MTATTFVLTEDSLTQADVAHMLSLHATDAGEDVERIYRVLVPADPERNLRVTLLDELSLADFRDALTTILGKEPRGEDAVAAAQERLDVSLDLLRTAGATATGAVTEDDPLPALRQGVSDGADEIIVVTYPHAVEDTFRRDWASRARDTLRVPVLHLYRGTSELG